MPEIKRELYVDRLLSRRWNGKVKIITGKKKNRIQIDFYSEEDLSRIVESLTAKRPVMSKDERIEALRRFSSSKNFNV